MAEPLDLLELDRAVAGCWRAVRSWRSGLHDAPDAFAEQDPFEEHRRVAGRTTFQALTGDEGAGALEPLRRALRRWVHALTEARVCRELDAARAREELVARVAFRGERPRMASWREAWLGVVLARAPGERKLWAEALAEAAPPLATLARERAARRDEVARRLGLGHAFEGRLPIGAAALAGAARAFLGSTDDLAREAFAPARSEPSVFAGVIGMAVGRDAAAGWPARLTPRWLEEVLAEPARGLRVAPPELPAALGASSFARALAAFGHALRVALAPAGLPFAVAHESQFTSAHRFAWLFGMLPTAPAFHRVVLGLGRAAAEDAARVLARTALLEARLGAVRLLLGDPGDFAPGDRFDELTARLFGSPMPRALAGAWPRPRDDEPARFLASMTALSLAREMVDRFDVDWFKNPRAAAHLRSIASGPAYEEEPPADLQGAPLSLARWFEEVLA
jgi:hypothetical protein